MDKIKNLLANKKTVVSVVVIVLILVAVVNWQRIADLFTPTEETKTGAITSAPESKDLETGDAVAELKNQLPLTTDDFIIESYDYKRGRFIVKGLEGSANLQAAFDAWYLSAGYESIPKTMFSLSK